MADTLVINCVAPVGGLVVDLALRQAEAPLETDGSSRGIAGVFSIIAASVAAGILALGSAAWYARQRWAR